MNPRLFCLVVLNFSIQLLFSQEGNEEAFKKTFNSELKIVASKLARRPNDVNLNYKYGLLCYKLCRYREAQKYLYKCINEYKDNPYLFLDLYHVEKAVKNTSQANDFFYSYKKMQKTHSKDTSSLIRYKEYTSDVKPIICTKNNNSIDYFPYVLNNDKIKYLTQTQYNYTEPTSPLLFRNYLTNEFIFSDSIFQHPKIITQPSKTSDGFSYNAFCLNKAQDKIYMTRYDAGNRRMTICVSYKVDLSWQPFRTIGYVAKNAKYNFMHPMLTENEEQLIFSSDMKGGQGAYDLWIADLSAKDELSKVTNLGNKINTIGNELFPTKHSQNSMFFSSDGHPGYGSLDIYQSEIQDNNFSEPINLGPSFNSTRDEYGLFYSKDKKTGYFTSNRSVGYANVYIDKIYKIKLNILDCEILNFEIKNPFSESDIVATEAVSSITQSSKIESANTNSSNSNQGDFNNNTTSASTPSENTNQSIGRNDEPINQVIEKSTMDSKSNENIEQNNGKVYDPEELKKAMDASNLLLKGSSTLNSTQQDDKPKDAEVLYEIRNDKIEEKFVKFSDKASISSLNTNEIIENKFWTTAKLWFKNFNIPISFTYIRVINPKNEVVYSNYTTENGMISVEIVENNEYTIEVPRFKTMLKGLNFNKDENNFYFPYTANSENTNKNISINKTNNLKDTRSKNTLKKVKRKYPNRNIIPNSLGLTLTKKKPITTPKSGQLSPSSAPKSDKKEPKKKLAPRNMIDNFS